VLLVQHADWSLMVTRIGRGWGERNFKFQISNFKKKSKSSHVKCQKGDKVVAGTDRQQITDRNLEIKTLRNCDTGFMNADKAKRRGIPPPSNSAGRPTSPLLREGAKAKLVEWTILNADNGENFALTKIKRIEKITELPIEDRKVIGLPEAGRTEPWNFIKINDVDAQDLADAAEDFEYILDDYDTLQEDQVFDNLKRYEVNAKNEYKPSQYVLDLKEQEEEELTKAGSRKIVDMLGQWRRDFRLKIEDFRLRGEEGEEGIEGEEEGSVNTKIVQAGKDVFERVWCRVTQIVHRQQKAESRKQRNLEIKKLRNCAAGFFGWQGCKRYFKSEFAYAMASFALIALLVVLPIYGLKYYAKAENVKGRVMGASIEGLRDFELGASLFAPNNIDDAKEKFAKAELNFHSAQEALDEINNIGYNLSLKLFNKDKQMDSGRALLEAGEKAAEISQLVLLGYTNLHELEHETREGDVGNLSPLTSFAKATAVKKATERQSTKSANGRTMELSSIFGTPIADLVSKFNGYVNEAMPKVDELKEILDKVEIDAIPEEYKDKVQTMKNSVIFIKDKLLSCVKYSDVLIEVFARNSEKRYLLIFQNNNELRPSGGFMGSYALVDIKNGQIINLEMPGQGSYYLQSSLLENIAPPKPLMLINNRWEFQDSNWWPDFPASARTVAEFYEMSGEATVDGVISMNASLMEQLLDLIGSIDMPEYSKSIDGDNFVAETQKAVELEYDRIENKPKKFLADLMPKVIDKIFKSDREQLQRILAVLNKALRKRDLQIYLDDAELEDEIVELGWGGEIKDIKNRDYLAIFDVNIGGRKTDGVIEKMVMHKSEILEDGSIVNELIIKRKHNGVKGDYFSGVNNVNYLMVYVPEGAVLLEAEGYDPPPADAFETLRENIIEDDFLSSIERQEQVDLDTGTVIGKAFGKTYFANWTQVDPGETATIRLKYKLPFNGYADVGNVVKYSLYVQRQSGSRDYLLDKRLHYPEKFNPVWAYPGAPESGNWVQDKIMIDKFYGVILAGE